MLQMTPDQDRAHARRAILIGLAGAIAMASAMGFGRFFYTPVLPGMIAGIPLSASDAGYIAAGNFAGYLAGAILSAYGWAAGRERFLALSALYGTAALLLAMGVTDSLFAFVVIRFLAGLVSALAMVLASALVIPHAAGRQVVNMLHFGGVGLGIAVSSALVFVVNMVMGDAAHGWRVNWIAGAVIVLVATFVVQALMPRPRGEAVRSVEPPLVWKAPQLLLTLSYGLFGFGYVITATFLVAIARMGGSGPVVEFLAWFVTGIAAAVSLAAWHPVSARLGLGRAYLAAQALLAIGVLSSVTLSPVAGALVGGLLLGATFMVITAFGLQIGRQLSPESPRRAFAFMTAAFGVGQIIGPLVAGWAAEVSGSFELASLIAVAAIVIAMLLSGPVVWARR